MRSHLGLSGWLYADLALVLFVVFLAATAGGRPSPGPGPSPSPSPTVSPTPCARTAELTKVTPTAGSGHGAPPTDGQLQDAFGPYAGKRAGIVLTFTRVPLFRAGDGDAMSDAVNRSLQRLYPDMFPAGTIMETFHSIDASPADTGLVDFYVYFLATRCA